MVSTNDGFEIAKSFKLKWSRNLMGTPTSGVLNLQIAKTLFRTEIFMALSKKGKKP
jgi:RecG-like helicase